MRPVFKDNHYFIAPDQVGHGKAETYISADEDYKMLKGLLPDEGIRR